MSQAPVPRTWVLVPRYHTSSHLHLAIMELPGRRSFPVWGQRAMSRPDSQTFLVLEATTMREDRAVLSQTARGVVVICTENHWGFQESFWLWLATISHWSPATTVRRYSTVK